MPISDITYKHLTNTAPSTALKIINNSFDSAGCGTPLNELVLNELANNDLFVVSRDQIESWTARIAELEAQAITGAHHE